MPLSTLDWRRRVHDLYVRVRAEADPATGHALWAEGRNRLLANHPASPVPAGERDGFSGVPVDDYDASLRFEAVVDTQVEPIEWAVDTGVDGVVPFSRLGVVRLPFGDLDVWWLESYGGGVFVPLRDTSPDTYGGGRYLLDTVKGADLGGDGERLVVDLNFAYNPSCAYSPDWVCPLAPAGNRVDVALPGGERLAPE